MHTLGCTSLRIGSKLGSDKRPFVFLHTCVLAGHIVANDFLSFMLLPQLNVGCHEMTYKVASPHITGAVLKKSHQQHPKVILSGSLSKTRFVTNYSY